MKEVFEDEDNFLYFLRNATPENGMLVELKERMSLERFNDPTFVCILGTLVAVPKFRQDYDISLKYSKLYRLEIASIFFEII